MLKLLFTSVIPVIALIYAYRFNTVLGLILTAVFILLFLAFNLSDLLLMRGAMIYKKNPRGALALMKKGFSMPRPNAGYAVYYSYVCMREGRWEEADVAFKRLDTLKLAQPDKVRHTINKSLYLWKQDNLTEAIDILEELLEQGESTAIYTNLGYFLILKGDYERALEINLKAHEYDENDDAITDNLALNYFRMGEHQKARDLYEELCEHKLGMPIPYYHFGELLLTLGEKDEALEMMEKALEYPFSHLAAVSKKHIRDRIAQIEQGM